VELRGMMEEIEKENEEYVIVLNMEDKNKKGCDINKEKWKKVDDIMEKRNIFNFIDEEYKGYDNGDLEREEWKVS
jgi:aspartate/tyrosine/aromatic aminotransferase